MKSISIGLGRVSSVGGVAGKYSNLWGEVKFQHRVPFVLFLEIGLLDDKDKRRQKIV